MKSIRTFLLVLILLAGCTKQAQPVPPTLTAAPPSATIIPPTETPTEVPATPTQPGPTADSTIFGAIGQNEIQAFALESVANAIFTKTMDGFVANCSVQEYQVTRVSVFPGSGGLLSEIIYNVKSSDPAWLSDGGTQGTDGWINGNCSRFDFFTTETEFQLKNKRLCG